MTFYPPESANIDDISDKCKQGGMRQLPEFSLDQVLQHSSPDDCWIVILDMIYDVTDFLNLHSGGRFIIMESAGRDATIPFRGSRHGRESYQLMSKYLIGILSQGERIYTGNVPK
jgi:cytochrome b involved in lipid metabolism